MVTIVAKMEEPAEIAALTSEYISSASGQRGWEQC